MRAREGRKWRRAATAPLPLPAPLPRCPPPAAAPRPSEGPDTQAAPTKPLLGSRARGQRGGYGGDAGTGRVGHRAGTGPGTGLRGPPAAEEASGTAPRRRGRVPSGRGRGRAPPTPPGSVGAAPGPAAGVCPVGPGGSRWVGVAAPRGAEPEPGSCAQKPRCPRGQPAPAPRAAAFSPCPALPGGRRWRLRRRRRLRCPGAERGRAGARPGGAVPSIRSGPRVSAGRGGAAPRAVAGRKQTCSGWAGGGARAGEAEISASIREQHKCRRAGGAVPTPAPRSAPPGRSPSPPGGSVGTHLSTGRLQGLGQGSWAGPRGAPRNQGPAGGHPVRVLRLAYIRPSSFCPGVRKGPEQQAGVHAVPAGRRASRARGRPLSVCLSVRPSVRESLEEAQCSQPGGARRRGHGVLKGGCGPSTRGEEGSRAPRGLR